ncbi:hypothetical protein [Aquimarina brevivitae]|uniref:Uncharacterized protein n=1 Tax=Aquimarina brevivitae TaxID=323412 RepID=A0A4Q7NZ27_9FLAO|nr:hypothetical protein [Aquimarina brevivitae]RZS92300.1 hypothetical protein EV197_2936 [Aquimarina brevivitae]
MSNPVNIQKNLVVFSIPLLLITALVVLVKSPLFTTNTSQLAIGVTADLLITIPLIYFLIIRKTSIPNTTVVPVLVLGMIICTVILPVQQQYYLDLFKTWVFPVIELSIVGYVLYNVNKAIKRFKITKNESIDFFTALKNTCYELLPKKAAMAVATEIAVFYYGFVIWKKRKLKENEYSYHKESETISLLLGILLIVAVETVVLHNLIAKWNDIIAWVVTFLSVYSGFQLFGTLKSIYHRPICIEKDKLLLRFGMMNETSIEISNIEKVEVSAKDITLDKETRKLSFLGSLSSHNIIIYLKEKNTLIGPYGIKKQYKTIALHVDQKQKFANHIETLLD